MTSGFFPPAEPQTLGTIADAVGAKVDPAARDRIMSDLKGLDEAGPEHISFLRDGKMRKAARESKAGAVFCDARFAGELGENAVALITPYPANAFGLAAGLFHSSAMRPRPLTARSGGEVAPTAIIEDPDLLEANVIVEPFAVVSRGVEIGRGSVIGANVVIGPGCTIGRNTSIGANSTIQCAHIGDRVIIHPGCRIGQDGFGLARTPNGYVKIPQVRAVVIQDDVELGANVTIDRGSHRDTVIGKGSKVDNQVQIGHNVVMGVHCVIAGCTGVSGSVTMGDHVTLGGHVGLRDGISLGDGCSVAGKSAVGEDIPAGAQYAGAPASDARRFVAERMAIARLIRGGSASKS
ncbi:UDP-3-O-(3-hydroxymyristoyl)glucosamine N-acyltransferase [Acuticoccus sp. MNP-M23]|uniref:UDP-3-O-(3-hydroxymyristoyl)glucosamine N-acyltransferase n=1 Tax=Acuticoccus sp. MNP-M23 TaxID=3072793 RepID=UPI0028156DAF|nr:UDP-3-O-(3-hydroxymyristoyl)glucosamine N-acyltransferase [Acuticoccus sp. MNP-M23]WMS41186.1 UDP-3-O-(3-hydroxymyristoyl)glucosamine N-acyltransferase [Acuticoccus sp. MNP-M23]